LTLIDQFLTPTASSIIVTAHCRHASRAAFENYPSALGYCSIFILLLKPVAHDAFPAGLLAF